MKYMKQKWFGSVIKDILADRSIAIALRPEAIGDSILADVEPMNDFNVEAFEVLG